MSHLLALTCATLLATGPWRTYEVYRPEIERHFVVNAHAQSLKYNHDSSIAWFGDRWFCLWNANEPAAEGKPGQLNYVATSLDGKTWTPPRAAFSSEEGADNPIPCPAGTQWQPNLIVVDGQLWAVWSQSSKDEHNGCYVSKLSHPEGKWQNRRLLWYGSESPEIDGQRWRLFPTQNPVRLRSGRVLAPITMMGGPAVDAPAGLSNSWWATEKRDSVLYTDDGQTWQVSPGTVQPKRTWAQWEPTVWQPADGTVMMFARNNDHRARGEEGPRPAEMLLWSRSADDGLTWTAHEHVPLETVASRMHVTGGGGDRFMMVHNDWPAGEFVSDRQNLALFFTRGRGVDFVAGPGLTGAEPIVAYPQMWIHDGKLAVSYSQGRQYRSIKVALVDPLPDSRRFYLFPRANSPAGPAPSRVDGTLTFGGGQHLATREVVQLGDEGFSLGAWICNEEGGTLFDNRSTQPAGGILWGVTGGRPYVYLGTPEHNIVSSLQLRSGQWTYTGVSVDNRRGSVAFFVDDRTETLPFTSPAPRPFRGTTAYIGEKRFESSGVPGFCGRLRRMWIHGGQILDTAEHAWLLNQCAESLDASRVSGATAPKGRPVGDLDPTSQTALQAAFDMPGPIESTARVVDPDRRRLLRICGSASAGVDLDDNERSRGDRVEVEFRFRVEGGDRVVVATLGDANHPARLVIAQGEMTLRTAEETLTLGAVPSGDWSALRLQTFGDITNACLNDEQPATVVHRPVATWLYLGEGYPDRGAPQESSLLVDVESVRTRVLTDAP